MERNDGPTEEVAKIASPGVDESTPLSPVPRSSISKPASDSSSPLTIDQARKKLIRETFGDDDTAAAIHLLLKDHDALKEKVGKLKALLGRSAKAQREAKVDLDATQKRLDQALREIERLNQKIDKLANRPSHLELLADFETNFDRALLSVGSQQQQQVGGEDTASPPIARDPEAAVVENLLMQELAESKQRTEKLESLNSALVHRSSQLEAQVKQTTRQVDELSNKIAHLELEKRMAVMEAEQAVKQMQERAASLQEMQMEIDLVTKASVNANARAKKGEELIKTVKTDKQHVLEMEAKVQALQEWALASSEAKQLAQERVRFLENQLQSLQRGGGGRVNEQAVERILFEKHGSFVIGAGDVGIRVFSLTPDQIKSVRLSERVVLRWHFDLTSEDVGVPFSIMRGVCDTPAKRQNVDYLIKDRLVTGGAEGETDDTFTSQGSCTIEWSNASSWVRPKTVKYTVSAVVLSDD